MNDTTKSRTVCFTGHREVLHNDIGKKLDETVTALAEKGYLYFGTGGAKGFDYLAAKSILRVQKKFPDIKLIIVVPCENYYSSWPKSERDSYLELMNEAHKVKVMSDHYYRGCMQVRNRHLVDNSSVCVCYKYKNDGGTAFTVEYARKQGLTVLNVI